jgi:hypothetical protein
LGFAISKCDSPFAFYEGLLDHIAENDGRSVRKLSQTDAFRVFYHYVSTRLCGAELAEFEQNLHEDYAAHEARKMPYSVIHGNKKGLPV